ncbi:hypothetical protein [uncultured Fibrobacter sp.]|uniref:hypothetical protein n=1 Tax=uncultured Fibrobacter sp. TaxID=261512 RepID=UPI0025DE093F|nr:hypothetical protein [uncultured Fibrobacter sp.]
MKGGINRLIAVAMTALVCIGMWGCSDDVTFRWSDGRGSAEIAGFIDDSLAVVTDCREWYEDTETWNGGYYSDVSCGHDRMMVYNYRVQENGPRWSDSLTNKSNGYHWYQMTDSVFWRWEGDNILLWKVGEKAHEMRLSRKNDGCSESFKIDRIRQWIDGKFIALGGKLNADGESCQYAVLDTAAKIIVYKRLDKNLEWIKECDDVRAWGEDVYCFMPGEHNFEAMLLQNKHDTIEVPIKFTIGTFFGDVLKPNGHLCTLVEGVVVCSGIVWRGGLTFIKDEKVVVNLN